MPWDWLYSIWQFPGSCLYNLTDLQGSFTSPNFPYLYPHYLDCTWIITVTPGYYVYLYFENFHLEGSRYSCPYDYVQIFDEDNQWDPIIPKYCDYHNPWCIYSNTSVLHVRFITDRSVAYSGFIAHYEQVYQRLSSCPGISTASISPTSSSKKITYNKLIDWLMLKTVSVVRLDEDRLLRYWHCPIE